MVWFKVDDGFHCHPKTMVAGTAAIGLWTRCGSWSAQHLQNGRVPFAIARQYGTRRMIADLVTSGLWYEVEDGYQFKDWEDRNPLREQVEQVRETKRRAGQIGGVASGKTRAKPKQSPSKSEAQCFDSGSELPNPRPVPTRPVPKPTTFSGDAAQIVAAYVEGARSIGAPDPDGSLCARVGKQAKAMLRSHDQRRLEEAAFSMGTQGWHDLAVEIQRGAANGRPAPNKATERLHQSLAIVRKLEAENRGQLA